MKNTPAIVLFSNQYATRSLTQMDLQWKEVLNNEAQDRIGLVHRDSLRVIPSKCLISPLKAVNHEVRELALKHYNLRLDVIQPTLDLTILDAKAWFSRGDNWFTRTNKSVSMPGDWEDYVCNQTHRATWEALVVDRDEARATFKGCLYLSSSSDTFLLSFTPQASGKVSYSGRRENDKLVDCCVTMLANARIADVLGHAELKTHQASRRYVSTKLPPSACGLVANVVYASPPYDTNLKPWPHKLYYPSTTVTILWMAHIFHRMRSPAVGVTYRTLEDSKRIHCERDNWDALISKIVHEGAKSLTFREWQIEAHHRDPNGWRIWKPSGT